eukprot:PhF_6_TR37133/c1_g1_i1/m.54626
MYNPQQVVAGTPVAYPAGGNSVSLPPTPSSQQQQQQPYQYPTAPPPPQGPVTHQHHVVGTPVVGYPQPQMQQQQYQHQPVYMIPGGAPIMQYANYPPTTTTIMMTQQGATAGHIANNQYTVGCFGGACCGVFGFLLYPFYPSRHTVLGVLTGIGSVLTLFGILLISIYSAARPRDCKDSSATPSPVYYDEYSTAEPCHPLSETGISVGKAVGSILFLVGLAMSVFSAINHRRYVRAQEYFYGQLGGGGAGMSAPGGIGIPPTMSTTVYNPQQPQQQMVVLGTPATY